MAKKKPKEYKRSAAEQALDKPLSEQEVRAMLSNELIFLKEPMRFVGGSLQAGSQSAGTGFKLANDGITLRQLLAGSDPSIQGWGNTMTFSAVDADTVEWSLGTVTLTDGSIYNIVAGNTGNMSALTYIYFDANVSLTVLQTTTTQATAVGRGKILVAVAQNNAASDATFQVFGGSGGILIKADNIAANTITANEIAANTITASQLSVSQLSAISANLGAITAGTITGVTITGATIQTASTGLRTRMTTANGIEFMDGTSQKGYIRNSSSYGIAIDSDNHIDIRANDFVYITFANNGGSDACVFYEGSTGAAMSIDSHKDLVVANDVYADNYYDYAEFFEAVDEFKTGIPVGTSVVLVEDKVRPANIGEIPIGAVSGSAAIILNGGSSDAGMSWGKKYLTDDFGQKIFESKERWFIFDKKTKEWKSDWVDSTPPPKGSKIKIKDRQIINPEWDEKKEFVHRKKRPEWHKIGLVGRVRLKKGQPVDPRWIKLKNISDLVEEWLIR
jgi:hypothetical protein